MLGDGDPGLSKTSKRPRLRADKRVDIRVKPGRDTPGWFSFRHYYDAMLPEERQNFVTRLGTTDRYIRTAIFRGRIGAVIALRIELETGGEITRDMIFPKWQEIWPDWSPPKRKPKK